MKLTIEIEVFGHDEDIQNANADTIVRQLRERIADDHCDEEGRPVPIGVVRRYVVEHDNLTADSH